jgi:5-methylcytosine-specific restriction protein A
MTGEGRRYAPKHVFGFALEEAIGVSARSGHFHAGWGKPCFEILEDCGLWIVPRDGGQVRPRAPGNPPTGGSKTVNLTEEEQSWIEGNPKIAVHLVKERQPGLAAKKRARFIADNGKLFCERCRLDPADEYGEEAGAACIEVHHHRTHVADMEPGHVTDLDDLRCLCSNCHRVLHRALTLGVSFDIDLPRDD